jgi:hypothetical protein
VPPDANDLIERLARIRRLVAELETECGRTAELREQFRRLKREMEHAANPQQPLLQKT